MNTAIIVDEEHGDTAAGAITAVLSKRGSSRVISLAEFLRDAGVWFDEDSGYLTWNEDELERRFVDNQDFAVCNRVVKIGVKTIAALDGNRDVVRANFVLAAYNRVLAHVPRVWGTIDTYPGGHSLPLNLQWRAFEARMHDVTTPRFEYGFGAQEVDISDFREPLWKSPFDLYTWKSSAGATRPTIHAFAVDKPIGEPAVAYFVGDAGDAFMLKSQDKLDERTREKLDKSVAAIKDAFKSFMGEGLFFVDGANVVFAAFSQHLKTSVAHDGFNAVLEKGLI